MMNEWAKLLSESEFEIRQGKDGTTSFRISQVIGTRIHYHVYHMSNAYRNDTMIFELSLNAFLSDFKEYIDSIK